jgi:hypothetical protein
MARWGSLRASALLVATLLVACTPASSGERSTEAGAHTKASSSSTSTLTPTTTVPAPTTTTVPPPPPRPVTDQAYVPFATVGGVTLYHPSDRVERVGFHEANHDGARQLEIVQGIVAPVTLETRERGTGSRTAADVVVDPEREIRSPVTGTVKRAGGYILYCDNHDDFAVIAPDEQPGWEVKILHISGVQVRAGQRVVAGETLLAPRPTRLPFPSQVEETAHQPPWPHVHIEVVDLSIRDRPNPGGGSNC